MQGSQPQKVAGGAVALLALVLLLALPGVAAARPLQDPAHAAAVPASVAAGLAKLKAGLASTSSRFSSGKLSGAKLQSAIKGLEATKLETVSGFGTVFGIPYRSTFAPLACVDDNLFAAQQLSQFSKSVKRSKRSGARRKLKGHVKTARTCASTLGSALGGASGVPASVSSAVGSLKSGLASATKLSGSSLRSKAKSLQGTTKTATGAFPAVFGVSYSQTYAQLTCIDQRLVGAREVAALRSRVSGGARKRVRSRVSKLLKQAKACESALEALLPVKGPLEWGSTLAAAPHEITGSFHADTEYWFRNLADGSTVTAPVSGTITQIQLKGHAGAGSDKAADGSRPVRFQVLRPTGTPNQTKVVTTTDPPFRLPGSDGVWTFNMSDSKYPLKVQAGDYVSLATTGDQFAVFGTVAGSITNQFTATGDSQSAGVVYNPNPYPDTELLMRLTEQPSS
jgi:hypothetical protein